MQIFVVEQYLPAQVCPNGTTSHPSRTFVCSVHRCKFCQAMVWSWHIFETVMLFPDTLKHGNFGVLHMHLITQTDILVWTVTSLFVKFEVFQICIFIVRADQVNRKRNSLSLCPRCLTLAYSFKDSFDEKSVGRSRIGKYIPCNGMDALSKWWG